MKAAHVLEISVLGAPARDFAGILRARVPQQVDYLERGAEKDLVRDAELLGIAKETWEIAFTVMNTGVVLVAFVHSLHKAVQYVRKKWRRNKLKQLIVSVRHEGRPIYQGPLAGFDAALLVGRLPDSSLLPRTRRDLQIIKKYLADICGSEVWDIIKKKRLRLRLTVKQDGRLVLAALRATLGWRSR